MKTQAYPVEKRFWDKVKKSGTGNCWIWTAGCNTNNGYGVFFPQGKKPVLAHRFSWTLKNGNIPEGLKVLHRCDNPPCCNPKHLFLGTNADNTNDCIAKGRFKVMHGSKNGMAVLNEQDAIDIRNLYSPPVISQRKLASQFSVSRRTITFILQRKTWKHV